MSINRNDSNMMVELGTNPPKSLNDPLKPYHSQNQNVSVKKSLTSFQILIQFIWAVINIFLLVLLVLSESTIKTCYNDIYSLYVFLFLFNILNPYSFVETYIWTIVDHKIFDYRRIIQTLVIGAIGCVALTYLLNIDDNTPQCFDGTSFPRWLAWACGFYAMAFGLPQMAVNLFIPHTLFFFIIPSLFSSKVRDKFKEAEHSEHYKDTQKNSIIAKIIKELDNKDFDKNDMASWSKFIRYDKIDEDVPSNKGFIREDEFIYNDHPGKIKCALIKSKYQFPINYYSKDTLAFLAILRKADNSTLSSPVVSAWLNYFIDDVSKRPNFFRVYFVTFNILYTIYILMDYTDLPFLNIFFFGHSTYSFTNNLYTLVIDPQSIYLEPEYIFSFLAQIGVGMISIFSWLQVDQTSELYTMTAGILLVTLWIKILYSMSAKESLRKFMILMEQAMVGLVPFLTVLFGMIFGFTFAFHVWNRTQIDPSTNSNYDFLYSFFEVYAMTIGGISLSADEPFNVTFILNFLGAFILNIILLSILIAILTKIQDGVDKDADGASNRIKIGVLMDGHRQIIEKKGMETDNRYAYLYWYAEKKEKELDEMVYSLREDVKKLSEKIDDNMKEILTLLKANQASK